MDLIGKIRFDKPFQRTAFEELSVAEPTPIFQGTFPYGINSEIYSDFSNNAGTATQSGDMAVVSTGASTTSAGVLETRMPVKYNTGQGGLVRFTALFTTGVANSTQFIGVGTNGDGFFFGYSGTSFGVLRRKGGNSEIQTLTVTTASSTNESITITLDGVAKSVAVTNSGVKATTAKEIAAGDYSDTGKGWKATQRGETVVFTSYDAVAKTGTFTLSGASTAVGNFAETLNGAAPSESFTAKTSWNLDAADNTKVLPTLDPTKGNVYQIRYQWLGFGAITFSIEKPSTGQIIDTHMIEFANANTAPTVSNPTLPIRIEAINTTNNTNLSISTASLAGFVEGKEREIGPNHAFDSQKSSITTETNILTIRNKETFGSKQNRVKVKLESLSIASTSTNQRVTLFKVYKNASVAGSPSWTSYGATTSVIEYDTAGTTISSSGQYLLSGQVNQNGNQFINLSDFSLCLLPGESLTITAQATLSVDVGVSLLVKELF